MTDESNSKDARIKNLEDALEDAIRYIGTAHCSGYKCRLPHCDSCCEDPEDLDDKYDYWWGAFNNGETK